MLEVDTENRGKQLWVGGVIIFGIAASVISLLIFWRHIPGWVGETVGLIAGVISTPFFLEGSFLMIGFTVVVLLNNWRRKVAGDEFVEVDVSELPEEMRGEMKRVDGEGKGG